MRTQARIIRILTGLVAGIAVAVVIMIVAEAAAQRLVPPAALDVGSANAAAGPAVVTLAGLVAGWFVAGLAGGWLAVRIGRERWTAWAVAAVILLSVVFLFIQIAHPLWMMIAGIAAPLLGAFLGQLLAARRRV